MKKLRLIKLDENKQYICIAKKGEVEQSDLVIEQRMKYPIPIIWVNDLDNIKFIEVKDEKT